MFIYLNGLLLGLSLIMALGPQNIFLIKQGARRNHAALSSVICLICDVILACASVIGLRGVIGDHPTLQIWIIWLGAGFLFYYAIKNLSSGLSRKAKNVASEHQAHNRMQIVFFALGFSLLNPHAIIDTLVIIGSGSSQFPEHELIFLSGVITASFLWFSSLFFTTRYLSTILTQARVWKGIEILSGGLMVFIAAKLVMTGMG